MSGICGHKVNWHLNTFPGWHSNWFKVPGAKGLKISQQPTTQAAKLNSIPRTCVIRIMNYSNLPRRPVSGGIVWGEEEAKFREQNLYYKNKKSYQLSSYEINCLGWWEICYFSLPWSLVDFWPRETFSLFPFEDSGQNLVIVNIMSLWIPCPNSASQPQVLDNVAKGCRPTTLLAPQGFVIIRMMSQNCRVLYGLKNTSTYIILFDPITVL